MKCEYPPDLWHMEKEKTGWQKFQEWFCESLFIIFFPLLWPVWIMVGYMLLMNFTRIGDESRAITDHHNKMHAKCLTYNVKIDRQFCNACAPYIHNEVVNGYGHSNRATSHPERHTDILSKCDDVFTGGK